MSDSTDDVHPATPARAGVRGMGSRIHEMGQALAETSSDDEAADTLIDRAIQSLVDAETRLDDLADALQQHARAGREGGGDVAV